ncbi:putative ribonuclease H-like domain-containing protein [Tanacetum coccineum]
MLSLIIVAMSGGSFGGAGAGGPPPPADEGAGRCRQHTKLGSLSRAMLGQYPLVQQHQMKQLGSEDFIRRLEEEKLVASLHLSLLAASSENARVRGDLDASSSVKDGDLYDPATSLLPAITETERDASFSLRTPCPNQIRSFICSPLVAPLLPPRYEDAHSYLDVQVSNVMRAAPRYSASQTSDAALEIKAYTQALKKVEAQLVALSNQETSEFVTEIVVNEPKVVSQPKVWSDAPIIKEYESDSEDEHVSQPTEEQETPSFANQQVELNKQKGKGSSQREIRPVWNNVQKVNHKNQFVPTAVLTRTGKIPVSTLVLLGEKGKLLLSPQQVVIGDKKDITGKISPNTIVDQDYPHRALKHKGIVDSGCSRHMTGNKAYLAEYQDFNGGPVAFGGSKGYITGKGKIKTGKLDFEDVCFVKELQHFNLFSVSQICDKKNKVLFTDSECLVLSPEFKLPDENQVLLRIPRQNNMYSFNLENIVPSGGLACLIAKATIDESNKWHRRLGHKGKQHKASCKAKSVSSISHSLQLLHMDLFGPTSVRSLNHKTYCLVITDDFSRFSWVFFLRTKDETSGILKDFIRQIENQLNQKVKTIRCDNGTEFKNRDFIKFCGSKGIKREYSNSRTPQQNGVAKRKIRTLIKAARTMLADSFLPNTFWAETVSTACYVLNRVLVTKTHNKTPYELVTGPQEANHNAGTKDNIDAGDSEKEDKSAQDYFVLPIWSSYSSTVKRSTEMDAGEAPNTHPDLKTDENPVEKEDQVFLEELTRLKRQAKDANDVAEALRKEFAQETKDLLLQAGAAKTSSTNIVNTASTPVSTAGPYDGLSFSDPTNPDQDDSDIPALEDIYQNPTDGIFTNSSYDDEGAVADFTNLEPVVNVSPIPTSRINSIHPSTLILGDQQSAAQTRSKVTKSSRAHAFFKIQKVWILVDLPYGKKAIGTKWVYRNKKDERGVVVRNKARLVAQGHRQEQGIDYDEVFAHVARIEATRIFLDFTSEHGFINGHIRGTIDKTLVIKKDKHDIILVQVYVDDIILVQVYVDDIIFGSTKKSWCDEFEALMKSRFQMSYIGELTLFLGLQVKQKEDGIFISQDKYVAEILKKFNFVNVKTASTPIETQKPLVKDEEASDVDVHLYRSMIGSLMYLTASRPDIMFAVCACSRFQVTPKTSHLSAVKRIFRYLKGKPKLSLWYPRVSSFDLEAYLDSDYAGANLDRKSTTGCCQFLGRRLISWQCKKQTIVATFTIEAEYVAAANCCGQVL